jgi:3-deoxy-D-manno-octulosonic-acid transferase
MILKNIPLDKYQVAIVPRHPERFEEVEKIAKKFGDVEKLSEINDFTLKKDIVVVDKMGELVNFYKIADIVVLGGSFVDNVGGHNPIEAAYFNKPIISGKYFFNQHVLYNEVDGIKICEISEISECLNSLKPTKIKRTYDIKKVIEYIK